MRRGMYWRLHTQSLLVGPSSRWPFVGASLVSMRLRFTLLMCHRSERDIADLQTKHISV